MLLVCLLFLFVLYRFILYTLFFFFFNDTATTEIYTLSLHDALPIYDPRGSATEGEKRHPHPVDRRSEEHTSELQSLAYLVCRLLLEKKKKNKICTNYTKQQNKQPPVPLTTT